MKAPLPKKEMQALKDILSGKPVEPKKIFLAVTLKRMDDGWHWQAETRTDLEYTLSFGGGIYDPHIPPTSTPEMALLEARLWFEKEGVL